jgi:protoheme IX farnesyltransferase
MSGIISMWIVLGCNLFMVFVSVILFMRMDVASARRVMFSSYFYLMIVFLSLYANKIKPGSAETAKSNFSTAEMAMAKDIK